MKWNGTEVTGLVATPLTPPSTLPNYLAAYAVRVPRWKAAWAGALYVTLTIWKYTISNVEIYPKTLQSSLHSLTTQTSVFLEKLILAHLIKASPVSFMELKVYCRIHKSPRSDPLLRQINSVHNTRHNLLKTHLNVTLPTMTKTFKWLLPSGSLTKTW